MSAIAVKGLTFSYEKRAVLEGIDVAFAKGEFIALFGPNGGGKTTFLKLLMGLLSPDRGEVRIDGAPPEKIRPKIGYVPQVTRYDKQFPLSVLDVVWMGCLAEESWWGRLPRSAKERSRAALSRVGLLEMASAPFGTLSGGQAQRVLLARAIASDPWLLFLDEPTASVDRKAQDAIYRLLLEMKGSITIVMVSHDLSAITQAADRFFYVERKLTEYRAAEVCGHFSLGLYHPGQSL